MISAISLFSGGLDSILASRVVAAQGITVRAVKYISPFFDYELLAREEEYKKEMLDRFGIEVILKDISTEYIELLKAPPHGYGKHFNPCVDCKIMMVSKAKEMMAECHASFLVTGEVIGQRPMSQRRDTLRIIERDSGCASPKTRGAGVGSQGGILLRPLCAKNLNPTQPELDGLVDRDRLYDFSGRGRTSQINLAKEFGITDYPTPAGGCMLADPILGKRIKTFYQEHSDISVADIRFIVAGRQFRLPSGGWLAMGRKESENVSVAALFTPGDIFLKLEDRPGPTAILRHGANRSDVELAAGLVARYGQKGKNGQAAAGWVSCRSDTEERVLAIPPEEGLVRQLIW